MNLRKDQLELIARDPRYSIKAYQFVMDALDDLERRRRAKLRSRVRRPRPGRRGAADANASPGYPMSHMRNASSPSSPSSSSRRTSHQVSGRDLCLAVRDLARRKFGLLGLMVFNHWGIRGTSDIGNIVYNLIDVGDLQKSESDNRADFDNVFELEDALGRPDADLPAWSKSTPSRD